MEHIKRTIIDQSGGILIACILLLVIVSLGSIFAMKISNTQSDIIRNDQIFEQNFYHAESGLITTLDQSDVWMTSHLLMHPENRGIHMDVPIDDALGKNLATVSVNIRAVQMNTIPVATWLDTTGSTISLSSDEQKIANDIPKLSHTTTAMAGSKSSAGKFNCRRYVITSTIENMTLQCGGIKLFNKF